MHTDALNLSNSRVSSQGTLYAHADFVLTGVVMTLLGPLLPVLIARWSLSDAQAGYLFIAQFVSSTLGMFASGLLARRLGYRRTMLLGLLVMAAGLVLLARGDWFLGLTAVSVFGVGFGATTPAVNLFVADANPGKRASALSLVNASWGIGAMSCPLLVAAAQRAQHPLLFLYGTAGAMLLLALSLIRVRFAADTRAAAGERFRTSKTGGWNHLVPLITAVFFVYVGTETAVGGWVASFAHRIAPTSLSLWAMMPAFFWGSLLAGRLLAPLALRRAHETSVASAGLAAAVLGVAALLAATGMSGIILGACLTGLGLSSIYPINVSLLQHWFGDEVSQVSGTIFSAGNLGGAALPWLVGALSSHEGGLRVGFSVPLLGAVLLLGFYLVQASSRRRVAEAA
jgi:MFS transporter, FHS family, glucose/mannose:H+ symporter